MRQNLNKALNKIRNFILFGIKYRWIKHGKRINCQYSTKFWSPRKSIIIGNFVGIGHNCLFLCDTEIGNKVMIASQVAFLNSDDHNYNVIGKSMWDSGRGDKYKITVDDDVWIGHGVIIMAPARIGRGSIVAAGSVVKNNVAPYSIVAGVPAKVVKYRFTSRQIDEHETILIKNKEMREEERTQSSLSPNDKEFPI